MKGTKDASGRQFLDGELNRLRRKTEAPIAEGRTVMKSSAGAV